MKLTFIALALAVCLFQACESTEDVLNNIDHTVPSVMFNPDTLEVVAGATATINAVAEDGSGIQRIEFTYGDWIINKIVDLTAEPTTVSYSFSTEITVPAEALKEWQEDKYFNDGTSIKVTQQYHKLALSCWDKNRNLKKEFVFIKVR
jgi:hypothetical protein